MTILGQLLTFTYIVIFNANFLVFVDAPVVYIYIWILFTRYIVLEIILQLLLVQPKWTTAPYDAAKNE